MADVRDFKLPDLGEGLEEGEIVQWLVDVGDHIDLNQEIVEVETAKAVVAVPSPFAGTLKERYGEPGESLEVGEVLCRIEVEAVARDVETADVGAQTTGGSPSQAALEATPAEAAASAPAAAGRPGDAAASVEASAGIYGEVHETGDADDEPMQPLVGYGEGKTAGGRRGRRRRAAASPAAGTTDATAQPAPGNGRVKPLAKPPVRKLAKDLGLDLADLAPGSGPDGVITREDVHAAAERGAVPAPAAGAPEPVRAAAAASARAQAVPGFRGRVPGEVEPIRGIRKRIVEKMEVSRREIPEAVCSTDADVTALWDLRTRLTEQARSEGIDVRITPFAVVMRAAILALRRFPTLNARIDRDAGEIHLLEHVNLGVAVDTDRGLMVPNIKDAHARSLLELAVELQALAARCRDGSATPADLTGGTVTVNNYGAFGNDDGNPIINHPEAAILGVGAMRERPWVVDGQVEVRRVCRFTLAFDHRVCDGGEAGRFVTYVAALCEDPARILLHS